MKTSGYFVFDSEGNGLDNGGGQLEEDVNDVFCICLQDLVTGEKFSWDKFNWEGLSEEFRNAHLIVGHNILAYDFPVLKRLLAIMPNPQAVVVDTLVWSRALYPDRALEGGHGLEAWSKRNDSYKPPIDDWSQYTPEILDRCLWDIDNNKITYEKLRAEAAQYDSSAFLWLEQQVATIIGDQCRRGHNFDRELAEEQQAFVEGQIEEIDVLIRPMLKPVPKMLNKPVKQIRKQNMDYTAAVYEWWMAEFEENRRYGPVQPHKKFEIFGQSSTEENFCRVEWPEINIGSDTQMLVQLFKLGWEPLEYTDKGNPKITDESFKVQANAHLGEIGEAYLKRRVLVSRLGGVKGWLENLDEDGRIRGYVNPQGAVTLRMTHQKVVNVPKHKKKEERSWAYRGCFISSNIRESQREFGKEWTYEKEVGKDAEGNSIKETVTVVNRMAMVGCDASGLENRMLANRLNDPELTELVLGDLHTLLWKALEPYLASRDTTKNWEYAFFYGAADFKLGTMLDHCDEITEEEAITHGYYEIQRGKNKGMWKQEKGRALTFRQVMFTINGWRSRKAISEKIPALGDLIDNVVEASKQGYLVGFDGRRLVMRRGYDGGVQTHKALNTLLQGDGALIMKAAQVQLWMWLQAEGIEAYFLNTVHDEFQLECYPSDRFRVAQLAEESIRWAGRHFNLCVPLDAEAKIGIHWGETH